MSILLSPNPTQYGTLKIRVKLKDEEENELTFADISNAKWQLMKKSDGSILNNRSFATCPLTSLEWVLTGADLAYTGTYVIAFKANYVSTIGGQVVSGLTIIDEAEFKVEDMLSMPIPA